MTASASEAGPMDVVSYNQGEASEISPRQGNPTTVLTHLASSQSTVEWTHCLTFGGLRFLILENDKAAEAFWDLLRSRRLTVSHLVTPKP